MASPLQASHLTTTLPSKTHPIHLRTIQPADAPAFSALLSAPENSSDPNAKPLDVKAAETAIARQRESASQPTICAADGSVVSGPGRVNMVLVLQTEGQSEGVVIGLGGYGAIKDWERDGGKIRVGDVGVMIDPAYRGKGYATEAIRLAINWAFTPVKEGGPQLDLVTITTSGDNAAMIKLADEKLGLGGLSNPGEKGEGAFVPLTPESTGEKYYELTPEYWRRVSGGQFP